MSMRMRSKVLGMALALAGAAMPIAGRGADTDPFTWAPFDSNAATNPTGLKMKYYVPSGGPAKKPIVVVLHFCTGTAGAIQGWLQPQADTYKFILVVPDSNRAGGCWDVASKASLKYPSQSDPVGIVSMVNWAVTNLGGDPSRVFVTGQSSGAMMTNVMLATYPDVFAAGAAIMGVPATCFATSVQGPPDKGSESTPSTFNINSNGYWNDDCAKGKVTKTAAEWGDAVRAIRPSFWSDSATRKPRMMLYHGEIDATLNYANFAEELKQWSNVLGVDSTIATLDDKPYAEWATGTTSKPAHWTKIWTRNRYGGTVVAPILQTIHVSEVGHDVVPKDNVAAELVSFFGLDQFGDSTAPGAPTSLAAGTVGAGSVALTWTAPSDDQGVTNYVIYSDVGGTLTPIGWPTSATYTLPLLTPSTAYKLSVAAVDLAGNISAASNAIDVTTTADTTAPTTPGSLKAGSIADTAATLTWLSSTDDVAVTGYVVSRKDGNAWTQVGTPTTTSQAVTGLTAGTSYTYQVVAVDAAGNKSTAASVTFTTTGGSSGGGGGGGGCGQGVPSGAALLLAAAALVFLRRRSVRA